MLVGQREIPMLVEDKNVALPELSHPDGFPPSDHSVRR